MGNRKRRNSSSRRITISISKSLSQVIARRDKTRGCLFACLPLKRECKGNKFTVYALDVFFICKLVSRDGFELMTMLYIVYLPTEERMDDTS